MAAQLTLDHPRTVRTLLLLELALLSVPSGEVFLQQAGPAFEAYENGDHEGAFALFMSVVSGLDQATCLAVLEASMPGSVARAIKDADTFFGIALPSLAEWVFGREQAAAIRCPVLSMRHGRLAAVRGGRRLPPLVTPTCRGIQDRRRRPSPAHPASPTRRSRDGKFLRRNCIAGN